MVTEFLLLLLATGLFYMTFPFIFVKLYGKVTSGKAFFIALLNWIIGYSIFLAIYHLIFPGETNATVSSGPALWFFVAWRHMTVKNAPKNTTVHSDSPNSIANLERKFNLNLEDIQEEILTRGTTRFALFAFKPEKMNSHMDQFKYLVVAYMPSIDFRYFAVEASFTGTNMLCEWIFDDQDKEIGHLNYGGVALYEYHSSTQIAIEQRNEDVLIDQIHTIISMRIEPEFKSSINESGWMGTGNN